MPAAAGCWQGAEAPAGALGSCGVDTGGQWAPSSDRHQGGLPQHFPELRPLTHKSLMSQVPASAGPAGQGAPGTSWLPARSESWWPALQQPMCWLQHEPGVAALTLAPALMSQSPGTPGGEKGTESLGVMECFGLGGSFPSSETPPAQSLLFSQPHSGSFLCRPAGARPVLHCSVSFLSWGDQNGPLESTSSLLRARKERRALLALKLLVGGFYWVILAF